MKLYKQIAKMDEGHSTHWSGSQADASKQRSTWTKEGFKRADITTEEVEVPTNKVGLLEFLNGNGG